MPNQESSIPNESELAKEFRKYLQYVNTLITIEDIKDISDYGEAALGIINFGWIRIIKFKQEYQDYGTRQSFKYEIYELRTTGGIIEPPDEEEILLDNFEYGQKAFMFALNYILEERLSNNLMAEDYERMERNSQPEP